MGDSHGELPGIGPGERWTVAILLFQDVEVLDFAGPFEVFSRTRLTPGHAARRDQESAPFEVCTVSPDGLPLEATGGLKVIPDHSFESCPSVDLLVVPGGFGTRRLLDDERTLAWLILTAGAAKRVVSVCTGSLLLAKAGLLEGQRATTHWGALDALEEAGAGTIQVERHQRFVDDKIVTSAGVAAGIDMAFFVVEQLCGCEVADETAAYIEYLRAPADSPRTRPGTPENAK